MIKLHLKLISRYWKNQLGRLFCLIGILLVGISVVTNTGYIVRSEKAFRLQYLLDNLGDYDCIFYGAPLSLERDLLEVDGVENVGKYVEVGYAQSDNNHSAKVASFLDESSRLMYHMSTVEGHYPENPDEIVIDYKTAIKMGVPPYVGETISLDIADMDGNSLGSKQYTISGIIQESSDMVFMGWLRYPYTITNEYVMPGIYIYPSEAETFGYDTAVMFAQTSDSCIDFYSYLDWDKYSEVNWSFERGRVFANAILMKATMYLDGEDDMSSIDDIISNKQYKMDFYSNVLIPIVTILTIVVLVLSLQSLIKGIIADRQQMYGVLRNIGLSNKSLVGLIIAEFSVISLITLVIGNYLGRYLHVGFVDMANKLMNARLNYGFDAPSIVCEVTYNPVVLSIVLVLFCVIFSLVIPVKNLRKLSPAEMISTDNALYKVNVNKVKRKKSQIKSWLGTINRRVSLHDSVTFIIMMIVASSMLFGYVYFCALAEKNNAEYIGYLKENHMNSADYKANRSKDIIDSALGVSNRHDAGVDSDTVDKIINSDMVDDYSAVIVNTSTRFVFQEKPDSSVTNLLGNHKLTRDVFPFNEYGDAQREEQSACLESMGFEPDCYMYQVPIIGIYEEQFDQLSECQMVGNINYDAVANGTEVIIAVPEKMFESCKELYPVGTELPLSEVVLNDDEEMLNFNSIEASEGVYRKYEKYVLDNEGNEIRLIGFTYGTRKDLNVVVGAIVALDDEMSAKYLLPDARGESYNTDLETGESINTTNYGLGILTPGSKTFEAWGLPDRNYTEVTVKLKENVNVREFDKFWWDAIASSESIEVVSTYDIKNTMQTDAMRSMVCFYQIIVMLVFIGIVSITMSLYVTTQGKFMQLQRLRMIGMSVKQFATVFITQNMYYPIVSTIAAIIPVYLCQSLIDYICGKLRNGELTGLFDGIEGQEPWYYELPLWQNLFDYNFPQALICCFLICLMLILIGTSFQVVYMKKRKMIKEED